MAYKKTFVCFANSVKTGGRCIAGKELTQAGPGPWLRPISTRATAELALYEFVLPGHSVPQLLDVIEVGLSGTKPHDHQTENQVIDGTSWRKTGTLPYAQLAGMVDKKPSVWGEGEETFGGVNDCISPELAKQYDHSLLLIKPADLVIHVGVEGQLYKKRVVRAHFSYGRIQYALKVTDPVADAAYQKKENGLYPSDAYLCVSLTEPYEKDKRCHKLAAAIITDKAF